MDVTIQPDLGYLIWHATKSRTMLRTPCLGSVSPLCTFAWPLSCTLYVELSFRSWQISNIFKRYIHIENMFFLKSSAALAFHVQFICVPILQFEVDILANKSLFRTTREEFRQSLNSSFCSEFGIPGQNWILVCQTAWFVFLLEQVIHGTITCTVKLWLAWIGNSALLTRMAPGVSAFVSVIAWQ